MNYCQQKRTNYDNICYDRATFIAWTEAEEVTPEDVELSCTKHLPKAVTSAYEKAGGTGYVRVAPMPRKSDRERQST